MPSSTSYPTTRSGSAASPQELRHPVSLPSITCLGHGTDPQAIPLQLVSQGPTDASTEVFERGLPQSSPLSQELSPLIWHAPCQVLLDQLPVLADVQRFMDELALVEVPEPKANDGGSSVLLMQQVGVTQERLVRQRDWAALAEEQLSKVFGAQNDRNDQVGPHEPARDICSLRRPPFGRICVASWTTSMVSRVSKIYWARGRKPTSSPRKWSHLPSVSSGITPPR